jgi:phospholipid/cholesterol/gamma-HCH transport system substrate-binding protein
LRRAAERIGLDPRAFVGLVVLVGGLLLWVLAFTGGLSTLFGSSTKTVKADFASVEDIVPNDPVRIKGVQVGTVTDVKADPGGRGGTLTMAIDSKDPIYRDASANILWRMALGANDSVAIVPGTRTAGLLGKATLPQSQDSNQVELDQITEAFHNGAQQGLRTMLQQLGPAFSSHPDLARDLTILSRIAPDAAVGVGAVRGQIQDTDLKNLVRNAGRAADALSVGTGASQTRQFVQDAAITLSDTGADPVALHNAIVSLRNVYVDGDNFVFPQYNALVYKVDPLISKLNRVAPQITPTLADLHPALNDAHKLLTDATPLLKQLSPAVDSLANTARVGVPLIDELKPGLDNVAKVVLPGLAEKYPEEGGKPVYELVGPTAIGLSTLADFFDSNGELANLTAGLGEEQAQQFLPCSLNFAGKDFLVCSSLSQALQLFFTGGTSLLQGLVKRPGGQAIYGGLLSTAQRAENQLNATKDALAKLSPLTAKYLFKPNHGGVK